MPDEGNLTLSNVSSESISDQGWCQVKETVTMLKLAAAQVEYSMRDGERSVNTLTESFMAMSASMQVIEQSSKELWEKHNEEGGLTNKIIEQCGSVSSQMTQAIVAFQFYDKLAQRLDHVIEGLSQLGELVGDPEKLSSPVEWRSLQDSIRSKYSMSQERDLFDALIAGEDAESVFKRMNEMTDQLSDEDIELF